MEKKMDSKESSNHFLRRSANFLSLLAWMVSYMGLSYLKWPVAELTQVLTLMINNMEIGNIDIQMDKLILKSINTVNF